MSVIGTRWPRRLLAWLLIAQHVLAGASLPCPAVAACSAERYPCEKCGCGCQSAEKCWAQCCCFTNQQKVAWAREQGVAVPESVVAAATREAAATEKPKCWHCDRRVVPQSSLSPPDTRTRRDREQGKIEPRPSGKICWLDALRCHGLTENWQIVRENWPGDRHVDLHPELLLLGRVEPHPFLKHSFSPSEPSTPPPKNDSAGTVESSVLS